MIQRLFVVVVAIVGVSAACADDEVTAAPKGTYRITQHYAGSWDATLHFRDHSLGDAPLAAEPDRYPWPAIYYISPDDQWILRVQKTGSGENCAFIYRVEQTGRVWRLQQPLDDLAFGFLAAGDHISRSDYYHTGIAFLSWDLLARSLQFRLSGTSEGAATSHLDKRLVYHLDSHQVTQ